MANAQSNRPSGKIKDITGKTFGMLTVVAYAGQAQTSTTPRPKYIATWLCHCSCGGKITARTNSLSTGHTKSCGCQMRKAKHGYAGSPTYHSWQNMKDRCSNPSNPMFAHYGKRGITVCDRWANSFELFLNDMGEKPPGDRMSIERLNNNANYEPSNCIWANQHTQSRNTTQNRLVTFQGKTLCLKDMADKHGLHYSTVRYRLRQNWSLQDALLTPAGSVNRWTSPLRKTNTPPIH